jgi:hypothetical protein
MANDFKRMQLIAGLITESEYRKSMNEAETPSDIEEFLDGMINDSIPEDSEEGEEVKGVWEADEYADEESYGEAAQEFINTHKYIMGQGGKITVEGNPDVTYKALPNGDIAYRLIVTLDEAKKMNEAENKLSLEEKLKGWVEFNAGGYVDTSDMEDEDKDKFERELNTLLQNTLRKLDSDPSLKDKILKNFVDNSLDIVAEYSMGNYGDSTSFSPEEYKEGFYEFISKDDPISSFYDMNESQIDEAENDNMLTQNDIKTLYNNGFNIIAQPDWNFVRIQKDFKSPKADWRFLNNLLSSKNIPSDIDYWRGDGDKGRNKRLEISKKYFDKNIKYPAFKESQLNENKPYALLATVADDWGKDSDIYGDLEAAVVGWTDRNGELSPKGKIAIKNLLSNWDLLDDYGFFIDNDEMNEGDTDYDRAKDAKRLGKKGEKNIYGAGVEKGEEIEKKKMKMSELKAAIKELALSEGEDDVNFNDDESLYDPVYEGIWSVLPDRIPEFIQKIKDIKDEYHAVVGSDDVYDGLDHAISAAEELMNSKLSEAKKDEEVEDIKDVDVTVGDEETTADVTTTDVDPNVKSVQDALTQAQVAAEKLGDDKLTDQIGNTITFFTRTHIVDKPGMTAESNIKERISKLVKSL